MDAPTSTRQRELFDEIVEQHGAALSRLCGGYEREPAKREELMQEILLALWRSVATFRGDASLRTWMYRVAHNVATTHMHRATREQKPTSEHVEHVEGRGPDADLDEARQLETLRAAIGILKPLDRQVVLLYLEEIPQAEIASITGMTVANVSTRVGRIKEQLARVMSATSMSARRTP